MVDAYVEYLFGTSGDSTCAAEFEAEWQIKKAGSVDTIYHSSFLGMGWRAGFGEKKTLSRNTGRLGVWDVVRVKQWLPVLALAQTNTTGEAQTDDGSRAA